MKSSRRRNPDRAPSSPRALPRRPSVTVGVLIAALTLSCAAARAGEVQLYPPTTATVAPPIDLAKLSNPDVVDRSYSVIPVPGGKPHTIVVTGYSLGALLGDAGIGPASFNVAEVQNPAGEPILLSSAQTTDTTATNPPVFWGNGNATYFADGSPAGYFVAPVNGVQVYLLSGALLSVKLSSSARHVTIGKQVHFTARVGGALPGETLSYAWQFDDTSGGAGASTNHSYAVVGTYDVYVQVTGSKESIGSAVIPIEVGKTPKGPNRNGGGTSKNNKAPTHGAGTQGSSTTRNTDTTAKKGSSQKTSSTPATSTTSATVPITTTAAAKPPLPHHTPTRAARAKGPLLSGTALAGVQPASSATAQVPAGVKLAARTGHLTATHRSPPEGFWITVGVLATMLAGALLEWAGPSRILVRARLLLNKTHPIGRRGLAE